MSLCTVRFPCHVLFLSPSLVSDLSSLVPAMGAMQVVVAAGEVRGGGTGANTGGGGGAGAGSGAPAVAAGGGGGSTAATAGGGR